MNKQQLASKIWESANKMRSNIEANEYKDYILGFIFYKFLSDKEEKYFKDTGLSDLKELVETNADYVKYSQKNLGYFISYNDLFSTWIASNNDFGGSNVRDGLARFERLISKSYEKVFKGIFETLQTGLSKLGDSTGAQDSAIRDLVYLIKDIPTDGKENYDVLGFIYEYLIGKFASNAGKKAGEFYTPHEVSLLMSDIIADALKNRDEISIYDPTSGSGSLLINIGKSVSKNIKDSNKIKYYAQELKSNTYNLTRMNLIMRGILPANITIRNGDTLKTDWPYFDDSDPEMTYNPLYVDAVVSNPPYSLPWESDDMENDARFKNYGVAPRTKADYAFLLHDLFHLRTDGIMTIVLPHGVLFRGGDEETIRRNLIEKNNIDAIIGLPANIFYGTGIPTIIMVLKKNKVDTNVQIIDASKGFIKDGKDNKLRASDIKRIVDCIINRNDVPKYSRVVSREEIRNNNYNLNIPRYVDSSDESETFDICSLMNGGIPKYELDKFNNYFDEFPNLKNDLFKKINDSYFDITCDDISSYINEHKDIINFKSQINTELAELPSYLENELINNIDNVNISGEEGVISKRIFDMMNKFKLVDNYMAYQVLDDYYVDISNDMELIKQEGLCAVKKVDPNMVIKSKGKSDVEVQDGWKGHILPFDLIKTYVLSADVEEITNLKNKLDETVQEYSDILDSMSEGDKESINDLLNEGNDAFINSEVKKRALEIKKSKICLNEDMIEYKIVRVNDLLESEKNLKTQIRDKEILLQDNCKNTIENLSDEQVHELLIDKWIKPIVNDLKNLSDKVVSDFVKNIENLSKKYEVTLTDLDNEIRNSEKELSSMLQDLVGNEFDMKGINEFRNLLNGDIDGK